MMKKNVYIGCGEDIRENFIHIDIRKMEHIDYICNAWEVSSNILEVDHIYSRHMLEHLTNYEADRALRDWFKSLKSGGTVEIIVPDMDFHCKQWLNATWDEENLKTPMSDAKHSFAGLWGWQRECDPWNDNYNNSYWDVHKSGYNTKRMHLLLHRIGFIDIELEIRDKWHLIAKATKPEYSGERQVGKNLEEIRLDHLNRYKFASKYINKDNSLVTDAACGVGYGSYLLSELENVISIQSLDISKEALTHAKKYFFSDKIDYTEMDIEHDDLMIKKSDYYISFETIEHLPSPEKYISKIADNLKDGGVFIGSTPNEEIMPFIQQNFLYHTKHFKEEELLRLLKKYGFKNIEFFQQKRDELSEIKTISDGHYIIFVAEK